MLDRIAHSALHLTGNSSETCGTPSNLFIMLLGTSNNTSASEIDRKDGKMGCYLDSPSARALTGTTYKHASSMTPDYCREGCLEMGFSLSGVEAGDSTSRRLAPLPLELIRRPIYVAQLATVGTTTCPNRSCPKASAARPVRAILR
jgi:hypothetical protein